MLFLLLGMDKRLRLNLLLLGLIFGAGILPDKSVEAGKCYDCIANQCRSLGKGVEEKECKSNICSTNFQTVTEPAAFAGTNAKRSCYSIQPDEAKCAKDKLGLGSAGGCFQADDPKLTDVKTKCIGSGGRAGESGGKLGTGPEPFEDDSGNTNGTDERSASGKQLKYSENLVCFCTGDLCNNWKDPSEVGRSKCKASVVADNNLTLFFAILGVAFGPNLISGGHLNRNIMKG